MEFLKKFVFVIICILSPLLFVQAFAYCFGGYPPIIMDIIGFIYFDFNGILPILAKLIIAIIIYCYLYDGSEPPFTLFFWRIRF